MLRRLSIPFRNRSPLLCRFFSLVALNLCCLTLAHANALWFEDAQGLHHIDTGTNTIVQTLPQSGIVALTLNQKDNTLWALAPGQLIKVDANGATLVNIELKTLATNFNAARKIALDPSDDSVWIAGGNNVFHLDASGHALAGFSSPSTVQDIALAQDETLWVLGRNQLLHYSSQNGLLASANLAGDMQQANFLALDDANGVLWLGGSKQLFQIALALPIQTRLSLTTSEVISALTLVSDSGTLWAVGQIALFGYSKSGAVVGQTSFAAQKLGNPQTLVADALSQSLWLGHEKGISRFSNAGQYLVTLAASVKVGTISTAPSGIVPLLTLVAPANNALTNAPFTPIRVHYDASCFGQSCNYPPSVFATYTLTATLNGQAIGGAFQFDPNTDNANYVPPTRYAEGVNSFSAYVTDSAGRRSKPIASQFTVDTIPPNFLGVTPPTSAIFITPNINLQGSIDDPTGTVFLANYSGAMVNGPNPAGQNFRYPITLKPGINLFRLTATDPAGNTNPLPLSYLYSVLTLSVTSPANGATVVTNTVTVTGTFSGATNPTITVNGVTATLSGTTFTAANVPLQYGSNTLTIFGTTPQGAQASQTLTVISTAPSITIINPANGATVNGNSVLVTGQVQAPPNSGVTVNGVVALIDANGKFYANDVPLKPGVNTIVAIATALGSSTTSQGVTVSSLGPTPILISVDPVDGGSPVTITFRIATTGGALFQQATYDFNGDGIVDYTLNAPGGPVTTTLSTPGIVTPVVTATDSFGRTVTRSFAILVEANPDAKLRAIFNAMLDRLRLGDVDGALTYITGGASAQYASLFNALKQASTLTAAVNSLGTLRGSTVGPDLGELILSRDTPTGTVAFPVWLLRGPDGVWRIESM